MQQGSLVNRLREAAMKLHLKAGGRWWGPLVGQTPWSADQWVPLVATAFAQEASWWVPMVLPRGFLALVGPLIHVKTRVAV